MLFSSKALCLEKMDFKVREFFTEKNQSAKKYHLIFRNKDNQVCSFYRIGVTNHVPVIELQILENKASSPNIIREHKDMLYMVFYDEKAENNALENYLFLQISYHPVSPHIRAEYIQSNAELLRGMFFQSRSDIEGEALLDEHIKAMEANTTENKDESNPRD